MFKNSSNPKVSVLQKCLPEILINANALVKMKLYVDNCNEEVGWLGMAHKDKDLFIIDDVILFDQEVHSTTTEITPEGLLKFGEKLLQQPNGVEIWNNIKVWGHSHANMCTMASGQDDKQMETFSEGGQDWFIRIIVNKKYEITVDLYNFEQGIIYNDIAWQKIESDEEALIQNQINELQMKLCEFIEERENLLKDEIVKEIKEKVKSKQSSYITYSGGNNMKVNNYGYTNYPVQERYSKIGYDYEKNEDSILSREDMSLFFDEVTVLKIGACDSYYQAQMLIDETGYDSYFTYDDERRIYKYAKEEYAEFKSKGGEV